MEQTGYGPLPHGAAPVGPHAYWEEQAAAYYQEHGAFLGDASLRWCPEGWDEDAVGLLGDIGGLDVLEVGCGAGQGTRWAVSRGARAVGIDLSLGMLRVGAALLPDGARLPSAPALPFVPLVQADARALPFAAGSFDLAFTAFGALPFVPSLAEVFAEVARVLRPGGRWLYATSHPFNWVFPDSPRAADLTVEHSYFAAAPYWERDAAGRLTYAEYQHTFSEHVAALGAAGFVLQQVWEPEWSDQAAPDGAWGSWGAERGALVPSTFIVAAVLAGPGTAG
ncbi:MAG: class I SAM-dependent methyltransferase [Bifidobacteriaceae bacterium]|nr:class I SAM-dependent methyltransferase [Bifidobacteriaceae bacterium]